MEERGQFTLYRSHWAAIQRIRKAADRAAAYDTLCAYALNGEEPDLETLPDAAAIVFDMARPVLDASRRKAENGKSGGKKSSAEKQETQTSPKPATLPELIPPEKKARSNGKLTLSECGALLDASGLPQPLIEEGRKWLRYKEERKEAYLPSGLQSLLRQLGKACQKHGAQAVIDIIEYSMGNGYQGIVLDRLDKNAPRYAPNPSSPPQQEESMEEKIARLKKLAGQKDNKEGCFG